MKSLIKIILISICFLLIATPFSPAKETPTISTAAQVQPSSVFDITYVVFIWTPVSSLLNPRWVDQFEFKAGDVFSAYTTKRGQLDGTWIESNVGNGTWFQAWVEREETSTTTTTPTGTTTTIPSVQSTGTSGVIQPKANELKYDINIWGISFNYTPPAPFDDFVFSTILGYGAYLGADAFFMGFANFPNEITCGSITPNQAEQGDTPKLTIGCTNANFLSAGNVEVGFVPSDGIDVIAVSKLNNSEIEVSIEIAEDADITTRTVTVTIDGTPAISPNLKFTVIRSST
jgi:hypothetical protein